MQAGGGKGGGDEDGGKREVKAKLERLLNASFHFLGIAELRDVPIAVMNTLEQVCAICLEYLLFGLYSSPSLYIY